LEKLRSDQQTLQHTLRARQDKRRQTAGAAAAGTIAFSGKLTLRTLPAWAREGAPAQDVRE
jgi:hypothetical protein